MNRQDELFQAALEELRKAEQMSLFGGTGEGSRGGHVVGHTSGGDAIYESQQKAKEHRAKAKGHYEEAAKLPQGKAKIAHLGAGSRHEDAARKHDEAAKLLGEGIPAGYAAGRASGFAETASQKAEEASKPKAPKVKVPKPSKEEKRAEEQKRHGGPEQKKEPEFDSATKQRQIARQVSHDLAKNKHENRASQHRRMARHHRDQMTGKGGEDWQRHKEAQDKHFEAAEKHDAAVEAIRQHGHDSETATKKMKDAEGLSGEANARSEKADKPTGYVESKAPRKTKSGASLVRLSPDARKVEHEFAHRKYANYHKEMAHDAEGIGDNDAAVKHSRAAEAHVEAAISHAYVRGTRRGDSDRAYSLTDAAHGEHPNGPLAQKHEEKANEIEAHPAMTGDWSSTLPYKRLASEHRRTAQELLEASTPSEQERAKQFSDNAMKRHEALIGGKKSFTENDMNKARALFGDYDLSKAVQQQNGFYEPLPFGLKKGVDEMEPTEVTTPEMTQHQAFGASTIEVTPEIVDGYAVLNQPFQSVDDKRAGLNSIFGEETVQIDEDGKIPGTQPPYGRSY